MDPAKLNEGLPKLNVVDPAKQNVAKLHRLQTGRQVIAAAVAAVIIVGLLVLLYLIVSSETTLTEDLIAGVWRIATLSKPVYVVFDSGMISLMEVTENQSFNITEIVVGARYKFSYKFSRLVGQGDKSPHALAITIPKNAKPITAKYRLDKIFVPGETISVSLNPSMGVFIATNELETLQLIKDNEMSISYLT